MAVDATNTQNMLVGTWFCLLRTTNGGTTWKDVRNMGYVNFIRYDPKDHNVVYASSDWRGPSIFLKSVNGGATWSNFDSGLPDSYQVAAMAVGPSTQAGATHSTVYAGLSGSGIYTTNPTPPGVPVLISPANNTLVANYLPRLDWNNATAAQHYQVQVSKSKWFGTLVVNQYPTASEYTPTSPLAANTTWYWRVRTYNSIGQYSAWSAVRSFRTKLSKPVAIAPVGGKKVSSLKPTFDWKDVSGAAGYTIQVSRNSGFTSLVVNATISTATSLYKPTANLPAGKTLYWRVRANGTNGPSDWMVTATFVTP